jgi:hypothetical protein
MRGNNGKPQDWGTRKLRSAIGLNILEHKQASALHGGPIPGDMENQPPEIDLDWQNFVSKQ